MQKDATLLANNSQHFGCYMLRPFDDSVAYCCMLLEVVHAQSLKPVKHNKPTTPNVCFVSLSPKRSATMLDPFAQLFQHYCGHPRALHVLFSLEFTQSYGLHPSNNALRVSLFLTVVSSVCNQCQHAHNNS